MATTAEKEAFFRGFSHGLSSLKNQLEVRWGELGLSLDDIVMIIRQMQEYADLCEDEFSRQRVVEELTKQDSAG